MKQFTIAFANRMHPAAQSIIHTMGVGPYILTFSRGEMVTTDPGMVALIRKDHASLLAVFEKDVQLPPVAEASPVEAKPSAPEAVVEFCKQQDAVEDMEHDEDMEGVAVGAVVEDEDEELVETIPLKRKARKVIVSPTKSKKPIPVKTGKSFKKKAK